MVALGAAHQGANTARGGRTRTTLNPGIAREVSRQGFSCLLPSEPGKTFTHKGISREDLGLETTMATVDVIRDTGETLVFLLREGIDAAVVQPEHILVSTPDEFASLESPANPTITIFLYRIAINSEMRNGPKRTLPDGRITRPLLPIELYYLITPWARRTSDEYRIVGRVLQVLYDNGELGPSQLQGTSWQTGDSVQVVLESLPIDDHYRIWDSSSLPYRLSLTYMVRVIGIEPSEALEVTPVLEAEFRRLRPV